MKKRKRGRPKNKRPKGHKLPGLSERFVREYDGQDPKKIIIPDKGPDSETGAVEPDDEAAGHEYPPPRKHPTFRKIWSEFIDNIVARENFKTGHLNTLEILCDLHVEYEDLRTFIRKNGRSYKSHGRAGMIWKFFPEVQQLNTVQSQITNYMKILGLLLKKDHATESGGGKSEWE